MNKTLDIIIPAFNEEESILTTLNRIDELVYRFNNDLKINLNLIIVNDGSVDSTFRLLKDECISKKYLRIISFSRNFGHQIAVSAGIDASVSDYVAIIDADLQDPPEYI